MTNKAKERAIRWLTEEVRSLRMAPKVNGCEPDNWAESLEVMETCLESVRAAEVAGDGVRPIDANATIEALRANFQQGSWYGCEAPLYQIAEDTISEMPTICTGHFPDTTKMLPLTLEQLRKMDGQPVWVEFEDRSGGLWGIVHISVFEQIVFPDGLHCTIGQPYYGKIYKAYAYPPAHIDREALSCAGCDYLDRENVPCAHCVRAAGYADYYKPMASWKSG